MIAALLIAALAAPTVTARTEVEQVTLGDRFAVTVQVVHEAGLTVTMPASLDLGAAFSEEDRDESSRENDDGTVTTVFELTLAAYDLGEQEIPALPINYVVDGTAKTLTTEPLAIEVQSYIGDGEQQLQPIAGPVEVTRRDWTALWVLGGLAGSLALIAGAWALRRALRRRTVAAAEAAVETVAADKEALARLARLEKSGALDADDLEPAYTDLSEIVRAYLGRRYAFPALDLTTEEIGAELRGRTDAAPIYDELMEWSAMCDAVKFADYPSSADEARQALYQARQIVQRSAQREEPAEEPPEAEVASG